MSKEEEDGRRVQRGNGFAVPCTMRGLVLSRPGSSELEQSSLLSISIRNFKFTKPTSY